MPGGIGILGGSFNPIHVAHLRAAEELREAEGLSEVRFVPSAVPPHKEVADLAPAADRLRMVELAIAGVPGFRAWPVELERSGPSYSVDTLRALRAEVGETMRVVFALGIDAFADFRTWREHATIFGLCDVIVLTRPPWPARLALEDFPVACQGAFCYDPSSDAYRHESGHVVKLLTITALDISATVLRARVRTGHSIRFLVPPAVEAHIVSHRLYAPEDAAR
jgi:nicotinate-nucleotide adenylyltransferase